LFPMPSQYSFPCPDCGTDWPCPEYIVTDYSGRTVTRWRETCQRLFVALLAESHPDRIVLGDCVVFLCDGATCPYPVGTPLEVECTERNGHRTVEKITPMKIGT
jgi:hypothetical protein